jgi:Uma2 family endonuclease
VEIRSENDYGPAAEREISSKRADYFAAGTLVVWDVDLLGGDTVRVFRSTDPENPNGLPIRSENDYGPAAERDRGEHAEAEPAVPTWKMPVDELFR